MAEEAANYSCTGVTERSLVAATRQRKAARAANERRNLGRLSL